MEFLTILLSGLLGLVSPVGIAVDHIAENAIRSQFSKVGELQVRVDNAPSYQLLQGTFERVRIAGRSLQLKRQNIRIAVLELESDRIEIKPRSLTRKPQLKKPLQAGVRLVLTEEDINQALRSPQLIARLQKLNINLQNFANTGANPVYNLVNPQVRFLPNNRLRIQVELQEKQKSKPLLIKAESQVSIVNGRQIQLVNLVAQVDQVEVPPKLINVILNNINKRLDLRNLEGGGLQARILKLKISQGELEMAAFVRIEPSYLALLETPRL
ncbi:LmeA family phospholipid-binding protein [Tolypothrix sp. VBCCA 56010]|uniref:LmeA family phospholipid-binding protein n=1 Tax=Tolypothrix sp. VBCCA 56010 TaxID=3137731 RepID=UPI003D7EFEEA